MPMLLVDRLAFLCDDGTVPGSSNMRNHVGAGSDRPSTIASYMERAWSPGCIAPPLTVIPAGTRRSMYPDRPLRSADMEVHS